jgi:hypothetical protein
VRRQPLLDNVFLDGCADAGRVPQRTGDMNDAEIVNALNLDIGARTGAPVVEAS